MIPEDDIVLILEEQAAERRALGEQLMRERDPDTAALRREAEARLETLEQLAQGEPGRAYVSLPGDWGRVVFVVKDADRFIGYEYGGAEIWTCHSGELEYFLAAPLGVQRLTRDKARELLEAME